VIAYRQIADRFIRRSTSRRWCWITPAAGAGPQWRPRCAAPACDWQMPSSDCTLTPAEYLQLLSNVMRALDSPDASFLLGQQMLPGHYGALSHALLQAQNLRQAWISCAPAMPACVRC
jgi:hypothetical protein